MASSMVPLQAIPVSNSNRVIVTGPCILLKTTTVAQQVRALRPLKKQESSESSSEPEFLRCKRRTDFSKLGLNMPKVHPAASSRRNARERNRVKQVNNGFDTLRQRVPNGKKNKKMSKVDTLRAAVEYIKSLQELLNGDNSTTSACETNIVNENVNNNFTSDIPTFQPHPAHSSDVETMLAQNQEDQDNIIHSPGPSECSDSCESSVSSYEERDLSDLATWIDALVGVNIS